MVEDRLPPWWEPVYYCSAPTPFTFLHRDPRRHSRRAPCGQPRREQARDREQHRRGQKNARIRRADLEGERRQPASKHQRTERPGQQARSQTKRPAAGQQAYLSGGRTEGHPDPDLLRALAHGVGEHTVQTQCGEQQRHSREGCPSARARIARGWFPGRRLRSSGAARCTTSSGSSAATRRARPRECALAEARSRRPVRAPSSGCPRTDDGRDRRRASALRTRRASRRPRRR